MKKVFLLFMSFALLGVWSCSKEEQASNDPGVTEPTETQIVKRFQYCPFDDCVLKATITYWNDSIEKGVFHMEMEDTGNNLVPDTTFVYYDTVLVRTFVGNSWSFDTSAYDLIRNPTPSSGNPQHQFLVLTTYSRHSARYNWDYTRHSAQWLMLMGSDSTGYRFVFNKAMLYNTDLSIRSSFSQQDVITTMTKSPSYPEEVEVGGGNYVYGAYRNPKVDFVISNNDPATDWVSVWLDDEMALDTVTEFPFSTSYYIDEFPSGKHALTTRRDYDGISYRMNVIDTIEMDAPYRIMKERGRWLDVIIGLD